MNKFFRRNQKKLLAVFGAFLMVVFLIQLAPNGMQSGSRARVAGTINGTNVTVPDLARGKEEWDILSKQLFVIDQQQGRELPLSFSRIPAAYRPITLNPDTFYLLVQEAHQNGITANDETLNSLLTNELKDQLPTDEAIRADYVQAISDLLCVQTLLNRVQSVVKISQPMQLHEVDSQMQMISLNVETFAAQPAAATQPDPTDDQVQKFYDLFKDRLPGEFGATDDLLGFGYRIPRTVKVQFIELPNDQMLAAAKLSQTPAQWLIAAYGEFRNNRDNYDSQPVVPATQPAVPATQPQSLIPAATQAATNVLNATTAPSQIASITSSTTEPATTQPTTRLAVTKVDDFNADFELHEDLVLQDLYKQKAQALQTEIMKQISQSMNTAFNLWHTNPANSASVPATNPSDPNASTQPAEPYDSSAYLYDLQDSIQKQYHVLPTIAIMDQFKSEEQLSHIDAIGGATATDALGGSITFPQYALELLMPWITDADKNSERGTLAIDLWQPSSVLKDSTGNQYLFRVSANESAHTPPLADVNAQVKDDWKLWTAYQKKLADAKQLLADALTHGLASAASAANLATPITTSKFNAADISPGMPISPLNLTPDSVKRLAKVGESLLSDTIPPTGRPVELAELYADRMIAVVELFTASSEFPADRMSLALGYAAQQKTQLDQESLVSAYVDYDAVASRVHFVKSGTQ